ncbi:RNA polymerase sigma factor [Congregibacter sp.]|uniref:RNA polymerase sigma factor n=1 Tax=Congregibacter sp. TaxID=2744308 RepID=UPI003F6CA482
MPHRADRALADSLRNGDERQFDRFFNEYYPRLYRFVLTRTQGDEELAQDMAQTTLINGVRGLGGYRGDASLFSWLCQICRNELSGHYRKLGRTVDTSATDDDGEVSIMELLQAGHETDPDAVAERVQLIERVQAILDDLPERYGEALEWKYIRGESVDDIASQLGVTVLAAQSLLARARTAFRDAMGRALLQHGGSSHE